MSKIKVTLEDGKVKEYNKGITALEIVKNIGKEKEAIVAKTDIGFIDLNRAIEKDTKFKVITFKDSEGKKSFWHSTNHVLAHAVKNLYPEAKLAIGPAIEEGFYYDFEYKRAFIPKDLEKIEKEMHKLIKQNLKFERIELTRQEAIKKNKELNEPYRNELLEDIKDKKIPFYKNRDFIDMCIGPHIVSTGQIKGFKLLKVSGAYWRGKQEFTQLQRIYGISFPTEKELKDYLKILEEAEKRDHRKLGIQLDLFSLHEEAPGIIFFHNKGTFIFNKLIEFMRTQLKKKNYEENITPIILNKDLWLRSGHWDHYKENMYFTKIDNKDFALKPMNCPGGLLIYKTKARSYRELPLKTGEFGLVHRHELSGVLAGLFRVRAFVQDDAHVFCTEEQLQEQIIELIDLVHEVYSTFDFKYDIELSTRPEKAMGDIKLWDKAENALHESLKTKKLNYTVNEGEGAFYGPKIDFHIKDALGRRWQCGTIQVDFSMPEKFDLKYQGKDGNNHRPVMLHRAIYGSIERFLGILIEHFAGKFPLWITPVQAKVLTVSNKFDDYAKEVFEKIKNNLRVELDLRAESVSYKVREAQLKKIPLIIIVGEKEVENKTIAVRTLDNKVHYGVKLDDLLKKSLKNIEEKKVKFEM